MEYPQNETHGTKTSTSHITVEKTTPHGVIMPPTTEQYTEEQSPLPNTPPTSTIQFGGTNLEQTTIDQQSIASSTQLDTPMAVPTQETGANTLNTLNQMTVNRDESTQMPSQEIQLEGISQSTQMPSQHLHSTGTQDDGRTISERIETIPTTSNNQEVSIDHIIQRRFSIVSTTSNTILDDNQTGIHTPTTPQGSQSSLAQSDTHRSA